MLDQLVNLDELTLRCRDERAKNYISEAVACYRSGAYRACIVTTWVAVVYDILHKLDELALSGDRNAQAKRDEYERYRSNSDISNSLKFEKHILELAKDDFELLSPLEYEDLKRLQDDRIRNLNDDQFSRILGFLAQVDDLWQYLSMDVRTRVETLVFSIDIVGQAQEFVWALSFDPLAESARRRIPKLTEEELNATITQRASKWLIDRVLDFYAKSFSYIRANSLAEDLVLPSIRFFNSEHVERLTQIANQESND